MENEIKESNKIDKKNKNISNIGLIITIVILFLIVLGIGSYIVYDKFLSNYITKTSTTKKITKDNRDNNTNSNNSDSNNTVGSETNKVEEDNDAYKAYNIGDKVIVKLNDSVESTFYVLKKSSESEEDIVLFAEKNIGESPFNNDFEDGNEYSGSLIEKRLNELTSSWTNVKEKRLITVDEIIATGLTKVEKEDRCAEGTCMIDVTYINKDSFLLYPTKDFDSSKSYESYWTMTKANEADGSGGTNRYVKYIHLNGEISTHIVGYKPERKMGTLSYGIRPLIIISKEYLK